MKVSCARFSFCVRNDQREHTGAPRDSASTRPQQRSQPEPTSSHRSARARPQQWRAAAHPDPLQPVGVQLDRRVVRRHPCRPGPPRMQQSCCSASISPFSSFASATHGCQGGKVKGALTIRRQHDRLVLSGGSTRARSLCARPGVGQSEENRDGMRFWHLPGDNRVERKTLFSATAQPGAVGVVASSYQPEHKRAL